MQQFPLTDLTPNPALFGPRLLCSRWLAALVLLITPATVPSIPTWTIKLANTHGVILAPQLNQAGVYLQVN